MTFEAAQEAGYNLTKREYSKLTTLSVEAYQDAYNDIKKQLEKLYLKTLSGIKPEDYYNTVSKYNRLTSLMDGINKSYMKASLAAGSTQKDASKLAITNAYYRQLYTINFAESANGIFTVLNPKVVDVSVFGTPKVWAEITAQARKRIESTFGPLAQYQPKHGTLIETLISNRRKDLIKLQQSISASLIQGKGFQKAARDIRKIMNTSANNALRIAITEGHRNMMSGNTAMAEMARSEGVDIRRQIVSTRDIRTRTQSEQVDKRKEDKNGLFTYPGGAKVAIPGNSGVGDWDINDRESVINNVDDIEPETTRGRDPVTGKTDIISFNSFEDWRKANNLIRNKSGRLVIKPKE